MIPHDLRAHTASRSFIPSRLHRFFPAYCALSAVATFGLARFAPSEIDADGIAYMDIADCLHAHHWACAVNGYWHPMYPAALALGRTVFRANLQDEVRAFYLVNFVVILLGMAAVTFLADSIALLRERLEPAGHQTAFVLDRDALRYIGIALLLIATQREFALGVMRPDPLLAVFLITAIAALLRYLATGRAAWSALLGIALGCAFLTKSFAFVFGLASIAALLLFGWRWIKRPARGLTAAGAALLCFAAIAGPYIAALSHQKGRLDFGDSGALNYAWYTDHTSRDHLEPYMTSHFGGSDVQLKHPQPELLRHPQIVSYAEFPFGTNPDWFDPSYWYEGVHPRFHLRFAASRFARNITLSLIYLGEHPESLILLALLLLAGARPALGRRDKAPANPFWIPATALSLLAWLIYAAVNVEERYVTFAFVTLAMTLLATLRTRDTGDRTAEPRVASAAPLLALLLALVATGESVRLALEDRREIVGESLPGGWYSVRMHDAAEALTALGVRPGDRVACIGASACVREFYWARLAGVRILTEIVAPRAYPYPFLRDLPNRDEAIAVVRAQGAKVLVADFEGSRVSTSDPFFKEWKQLGDTTLYALPLNLTR